MVQQGAVVDDAVSLTKKEWEVLTLVDSGLTSREIANLLECSKRTIDYHLSKIYEKVLPDEEDGSEGSRRTRIGVLNRAKELGIFPRAD